MSFRRNTTSTTFGRGVLGCIALTSLAATCTAQQFPAIPNPGQQIPGQQIPGIQIPGRQIPGQFIPGRQLPGQQLPGQQFPAVPFPGQQLPGQQFPGQQFPGQQFPGTPVIPGSTRTADLGVRGNFTAQGMVVTGVTPGSPADVSKVLVRDLIIKADNVFVRSQAQLNQAIQTSGGSLQLVVRRGGVIGGRTIRIQVDLKGNKNGRIRAPYMLGVAGTVTFNGFIIRKVYNNTPAKAAGIRIGDALLQINGQALRNTGVYYNALYTSGGQANIQLRRGGRPTTIRVRLAMFRFGTLGDFNVAGHKVEIVAPETPAAAAGIRTGDQVVSMDGRQVTNQQLFKKALDQSGGAVAVKLRRGFGQPGQLNVSTINNLLGCWCEPVRGGMRVLSVQPTSQAARANIQRGDIILRIDNRPTQSLQQLQLALQNANGIMVVDFRSTIAQQIVRIRLDLGN